MKGTIVTLIATLVAVSLAAVATTSVVVAAERADAHA